MDWKKETLEFYDLNAAEFSAGTLVADMEDALKRFVTCLPAGACVLDFGCGSGRDTKAFLDLGFQVDALDGSEELCVLASRYTGIPVKHMLFNGLDAADRYDGIWACASILHLPRAELVEVISKLELALKLGGVLYASFKLGDFEGMRNGRYFIDFMEESLKEFWTFPGLKIFDVWVTQDVREDRKERQWINLLARRV